MITKLTLTIEESVISSAKKYAKAKGKSVSDLVENYLKSVSGDPQQEEKISPKVLRLMGSIKLPENFAYKKALGESLAKKYK